MFIERKSEEGQSTIEFILSFVFGISILFLLLRIALNYTEGYIVHYATFMSSRAYLVYEGNHNTPLGGEARARQIAQEVFERTYPIFDGDFDVMSPDMGSSHSNLFVGTRADFQRRFSIPMVIGSADELNLVSESFLGRIPNRAECLERVCAAMRTLLGLTECGSQETSLITLADNGC